MGGKKTTSSSYLPYFLEFTDFNSFEKGKQLLCNSIMIYKQEAVKIIISAIKQRVIFTVTADEKKKDAYNQEQVPKADKKEVGYITWDNVVLANYK